MRLTARRSIAVMIATILASTALLALPADAKKKPRKKGCPVFTPVEPVSNSEQTAEALEAEVVKVTDAATADTPVVLEYSHGPALWESATQTPIHEDTVFFNIQVETKQGAPGLHVLQEWAKRPPTDMDLYMYEGGEQVALSGSFNLYPMPSAQVPGHRTGGWGLESIPGFATYNCAGFTVESRAFRTPGEAMTLSLWLGERAA
jgi:hypothetical protein